MAGLRPASSTARRPWLPWVIKSLFPKAPRTFPDRALTRETSSPRTPAWWKHDDGSALLHPAKEVDDVFIGHADAAGRYGLADIFRLVGAVDAIQRVLVAFVEVERACAQRIGRPSGNASR